jgi:O-antigen ligase
MKNLFDKLLSLIYILSIPAFISGTIISFSFGLEGVRIYPLDLIAGILTLILVIQYKNYINQIKKDNRIRLFYIFIIVAVLSLIFSPIDMSVSQRVVSFMYPIRLVLYFSFFISIKFLNNSKIKFENVTKICPVFISLGMIFLGWVQYFLYPDLRNLLYLGWDPHLSRIFGTLLDPNFFGIIMVFSINFYLNRYLSNKKIIDLIFSIVSFVTLAFTYSRSSYLAFCFMLIYILIAKRKYIFLGITLTLFILLVTLLPRPFGEGVKLERIASSWARVENWKKGVNIFIKYPLFGVGYNSLRFLNIDKSIAEVSIGENHSAGGFDSSLLTIAVTTGVLGLFVFVLFLITLFKSGSVGIQGIFIAILIHSIFVNSLLFPWVLYWIYTSFQFKERISR